MYSVVVEGFTTADQAQAFIDWFEESEEQEYDNCTPHFSDDMQPSSNLSLKRKKLS